MTNVLLLGASTIGRMIATLLTQSSNYQVRVGDTCAAEIERLKSKLGVDAIVVDAANESLAVAMVGQTKTRSGDGGCF